jgi:hypothetical protein
VSKTIRLLFDPPQSLHRIEVLFVETARERVQEFVLRWASEVGGPLREIVRQHFHFSPGGAVQDMESFSVSLTKCAHTRTSHRSGPRRWNCGCYVGVDAPRVRSYSSSVRAAFAKDGLKLSPL